MIRKATINDIPRLIELLRQVNGVHHSLRPDLFKPQTTKYSSTQLKHILADHSKAVFVYEDTDISGYVIAEIEDVYGDRLLRNKRTLYIDDLCVDANARGQHIGQQLFDHVHAFADSMGCDVITLNVWEGNTPALMFYQKQGMHVRKTCMELPVRHKKPEKSEPEQPKSVSKIDSRVQKMVLVLGKQILPRRQLIADLGLKQKSRKSFINNYLKPAYAKGLIKFAFPSVPSKPEQAYRLTRAGLELYDKLIS